MSYTDPREAMEKIRRYCAYQERSHLEVRNKLYGYGLSRDDVDEILSALVTEGFLNEERFAKSYAGGKFRMKKWGRIRIRQGLESKGVSATCVRLAMNEIDEQDYEHTLTELLTTRAAAAPAGDLFSTRDKLSKYAIGKGYEPDLVWRILRQVIPD